ncbi:MAG: UbiA family prenyltransferase, partial [Saprospiraceae bacterium]|nr:UbiA family prenyltransferase [Saprospiraceae bacterium]
VLTLYYYSKRWKNSILLGNVVVSLFIAFTAGIVWFAERNGWSSIQILSNKYKVAEIFIVYMSLSFIVNFIREIIKDIEDMEGDKSAGLTTFPLKYSIISALRLANGLVIFTIVGTLIWLFLSSISTFAMKMYFLIFVLSPLVLMMSYLKTDTSKATMVRVSSLLKWVLVAGLFSIFMMV